MQTEPITGAMGTLEKAGIPEEHRMATIQAIAEMQQPLFDAIGKLESRFEKLESKMDNRFEKMESAMETRFEKMKTRIEKLESKMETRFKTVETNVTDLRIEVIGRDVRLAKRDLWLILTGMSLVLAIVGGVVRLQTLLQPLISAL